MTIAKAQKEVARLRELRRIGPIFAEKVRRASVVLDSMELGARMMVLALVEDGSLEPPLLLSAYLKRTIGQFDVPPKMAAELTQLMILGSTYPEEPAT